MTARAPVLNGARTKQVSPPRVTPATHEWLMDMSAKTGLSVAVLVSALLDHARRSGWTVEPLAVREGNDA